MGLNMGNTVVVNLKNIKAVRRPVATSESARRPNRWWGARIFDGKQQPTTFHKCLALHIYVSERVGALD